MPTSEEAGFAPHAEFPSRASAAHPNQVGSVLASRNPNPLFVIADNVHGRVSHRHALLKAMVVPDRAKEQLLQRFQQVQAHLLSRRFQLLELVKRFPKRPQQQPQPIVATDHPSRRPVEAGVEGPGSMFNLSARLRSPWASVKWDISWAGINVTGRRRNCRTNLTEIGTR
jgi:hypothetical protein